MTHFLAVRWATIIDKQAIEAIPAVPAIPAVLDSSDNEISPAIPEIPEVPAVDAVTHDEPDRVWVEDAASAIAKNLHAGLPIDYFELEINDNRVTVVLHKVQLKAGPRTSLPAREVQEVEANGETVGSVEVDA